MKKYQNKDDKEYLKETDRLETRPYESLAKQVQAEYNLAYDHQSTKKYEWMSRLKLYNNQRRKKDSAGDTTMFTIHQTITASLYVDRLRVKFGGRNEGDEIIAENLNAMAENDYDDMGKNITDYDWTWDAGFFGYGLCSMQEYLRDPEKNIFIPIPEIIDPISFLRDPNAISINGNRLGKNGCRFFGRKIRMTKKQMQEHPHFFNNIDFKEIHFCKGDRDLMGEAKQARDDAQGNTYQDRSQESNLGVNGEYDITEWNTHWEFDGKVKKCRVWLANDRSEVVGLQKLDQEKWSVIYRPLYPNSHDFDGTSITDLTEDKQRMRAMAQNLGMSMMKADLYPMYIYNSNKIKNTADLGFEFNKWIPVDGDVNGASQPLIKNNPNLALLDFIYSSLDISAQKATACYSEDTQTLTENGWKYFWEYQNGDKVATFNPNTEMIEYHLPIAMRVYDFEGEMWHYKKDDSVDILVTPNHRMWHRSADWKKLKKDNGWKLTPANEIKLKNIQFLTGAEWDGPDAIIDFCIKNKIETDNWLEFLGYYISEGCVYRGTQDHKQNRINIAQKEGEDCDKIEKCLRKLPIKVNKRKNKEGYIHFDIYNEIVANWLEKYIGRYSYGKHLPKELKNISKRQLRILFDAYMLGDGSFDERKGRKSAYFSTVSKKLADDLQEICLKLGYKTKLITRQDKRGGKRLPYFRVSLCKRTTPEIRVNKDLKKVDYAGSVYCFEIPNHLFITRRNGIIAIQGNTPEIQQGQVSEARRTASEINLAASKVDTRYSLTAKVFGWSEKEFWQNWYYMHQEYFGDNIDEKAIRIKGIFGNSFRSLNKKEISMTSNFDIDIESSEISRAKQIEDRNGLIAMMESLANSGQANMRYALKRLAKSFDFKSSEIDSLIPPTPDEIQARNENFYLNDNKPMEVMPEDDDVTHLNEHKKANQTAATFAHMETHLRNIEMKKRQQSALERQAQSVQGQQQGQQGQQTQQENKSLRPIQPSQTSGQGQEGVNE